jgi:arylsulfatase A-like enzyme
VQVGDPASGRLFLHQQREDLADDTIVFYYSDNGGVQPGSKRFRWHEPGAL